MAVLSGSGVVLVLEVSGAPQWLMEVVFMSTTKATMGSAPAAVQLARQRPSSIGELLPKTRLFLEEPSHLNPQEGHLNKYFMLK